MGLFDWVKSSYPLPEPFMGLNQTKDIEEGYSGTMSNFWIDPAGYLWVGVYKDTHTFETIDVDQCTSFTWYAQCDSANTTKELTTNSGCSPKH